MGTLTDVQQWETGISRMEIADLLRGGDGGELNRAAQQLANRAAWLKQVSGYGRLVFNVQDPYYGWRETNTPAQMVACIRNVHEAAAAATLYFSKMATQAGADSFASPDVLYPVFEYEIDDDLPLYAAARVIAARGAVLRQLDAAKDIFVGVPDFVGYLTVISGFHFMGGSRHIALSRGVTDTAFNMISGCDHSGGDPTKHAVDLNLPGTLTVIRGKTGRVLDAPRYLQMVDCDAVVLDTMWMNGAEKATGKKPADSASIVAKCVTQTNSRLIIDGGLFIPEDEASPANALTRWIDLYDHVALEARGAQFSGENGGFPVVHYFGSGAAVPAGSPYAQSGGIIIDGGQLSAGASDRSDRGVVVMRTGVPPRVEVRGGCDAFDGYVINDLIAGGAAAWLAGIAGAQHPRISVSIRGVGGSGTIPIGRDVAGVPTAISDLDNFAEVFDVQVVGGPNRLSAPSIQAARRLFVPAKTRTEVLTDAGIGDGLVEVENGNGLLAYQTQGGLRFLAGTPGLARAGAAFRAVGGDTTINFADGIVIFDCTAGDCTATLESTAGLCLPGDVKEVLRYAGANDILLEPNNGLTIAGSASLPVSWARFVFFDGVWLLLDSRP